MTPLVVGLTLAAALLHATWNAFLRGGGGDLFWSVTVMSFASTAVALPLLLFFPPEAAEVWPYVVLSAVLQVAYSVLLIAAYRHGELGQVYPITRGTVPLLVTLGGFVFAGEGPGLVEGLGIALVAAGILSLAGGRRGACAASVLLAVATGATVAAYATVDSLGVRRAGDGIGYTAAVVALYGLLLPATFLAVRRKLVVDVGAAETWRALGGGLIGMIAYGGVVLAFALGPAGPITALRETSVVFAALIGWLILGEALTLRRVLACTTVAAGAVLLGH